MSAEENKSNNNKKVLVIVVLAILIIINGVQFFLSRQSEQKNKEMLENKQMELLSTYGKLDSISTQLNDKIEEIKLLGGNVDSLLTIKDELEKEKDELRRSRDMAQQRYIDIKDKIEGYEFLLKRKDQEIAKFKEVNEELLSENYNLKEQKNSLNQEINSLKKEKGQMEEKISAAGALKAENITFLAVNSRGKAKEDTEFKAKSIDVLRVIFNLADNKLAELGGKTIIMRVIEPEGSALYNAAAGSGTFMYDGEEIFYTASQEILFDNSMQKVTFDYNKGSEFKKGRHKAEFYAEGAQIGSKFFIVK
ncbi:chromosome segregation protein SMC [Flammeovirgaceae bacterium SG7u.111]|nr:chromosome segregation protein SMC [Flammeovirgaceae bacterium SG7u.132]WPO36228.1 chromosome segregation protein SMC [Flammeovirgaceae bacterium SG7u.111]